MSDEEEGTVCVLPEPSAPTHQKVHPQAGDSGPPAPDDRNPLTPVCNEQGKIMEIPTLY